jgi:hypothetical protein
MFGSSRPWALSSVDKASNFAFTFYLTLCIALLLRRLVGTKHMRIAQLVPRFGSVYQAHCDAQQKGASDVSYRVYGVIIACWGRSWHLLRV